MPAKQRRKMPNLVDSVNAAIGAMPWLTPADQATVDLALRYANQIEEAAENGSPAQRDKMLGWLGPHLSGLLKTLGGTPAERRALNVETAPVKSRLAELRELRGAG